MHLITTVYGPILALAGLVLVVGAVTWTRDTRAADPTVDHARRVARVRRLARAGRHAEAMAASGFVSRARVPRRRRNVGWVTLGAAAAAGAHAVGAAAGSIATGTGAAARRGAPHVARAAHRSGASVTRARAAGAASATRMSRTALRHLSAGAARLDAAAISAQAWLVAAIERKASDLRVRLPTASEIEAAIRNAEAAVRDRVASPPAASASPDAADEPVVAVAPGSRAEIVRARAVSREGETQTR